MRSLLSRLAILLAVLALILLPAILSVEADIRRADASFAAGDYASAAADYGHAARLYFWRGDLWERAGRAAFAGGNLEEAVRLLESVPALSVEGWTDLGAAYFQLGRVDESIRVYRRGLDAVGGAPSLYRGLVLAYNAQGDLESERAALANYLVFQNDDAAARYRFGLLQALDNPDRALDELAVAAEQDADYDPAYQTLRTALNLASLESDDSKRLVIVGRGLGLVQEWPLAQIAFQRAVEADGKNAEAWAWVGEAKQHLGQDGRAELERAEYLAPFNANVRALFGLYWKRLEEYERSLAEFQWAAILEPENPHWQAALGEAYALAGQLPPALEAYQRATALAPTDASFWRLLAVFCATYSYQAAEVGLNAAHQVAALAPDNAASYDLLGWLYLSSGLLPEAETALTRALDMDPNLASAHLRLAQVYMQRDRWEEARAELLLARDLDPGGETGTYAAQLLEQYFP
ncbi:MAG: tetratricopeptide repeat protein [Chloroflexota bacterium]